MTSLTDLFAGAGGSTTGATQVPGITVRLSANHWKLAVDVHQLNHPNTDHACVDLHLEDPRRFPKTDLLWASPECTKWSQARGKSEALTAQLGGDPTLFDEVPDALTTSEEDEITRSRLLMFDVLRFVEHHRYRAVVVENVVDIATQAKYSAAWTAWRRGLRRLGYAFHVVSHNAMHAQHAGMPAPQSRDRLYVVAWPEREKAPDIAGVMRPRAYCPRCDRVVESVQAWKPGRTVGKYRSQYVYACSRCNHVVEPGWLPAAAAIDWTIRGQRIGDRDRPLADKTRRRIAAGIARYWTPLHMEAAGHTYDAADPNHPNYGDPDGYYRAWPIMEQLRTLHTIESKALVVPVEGRDGKRAKAADEWLRTMTTRNETGLACPPFVTQFRDRVRDLDPEREPLRTIVADGANHALVRPFVAELRGGSSDARPVDDPLATVTASGNHHALVSPYYGNSDTAKPADDPLGTLTTRDRYALITSHRFEYRVRDGMTEPAPTFAASGNHVGVVTPGDLEAAEARVDDCEFRMFEPHEVSPELARLADAARGWRDKSPRAEHHRAQMRDRARRLRYERALSAMTREQTSDALIEDVEWMLTTGDTPDGICSRLNVSRTTLAKRLDRAGRRDLARAIDRVGQPDALDLVRTPRRVA